ncbi:adenylate kinase [Klebsiella aerogenes]|nr:adenylate kinase [Klebsiella aerogenes]
MKINVVGTSGVGKSTLAQHLAAALSLPYIELDRLYWRPEWEGAPDEEFFASIAQATASAGWVLDGNYNRSRAVKWRDIDLVVWVDYSFVRTLYQAIRRALSRAWHQQELWPGTGNRETFRRTFCNRDSIILWTMKTWRSNRQRYLADMHSAQYGHIRFVRLRNQRQTERFIAEIVHQQAMAGRVHI